MTDPRIETWKFLGDHCRDCEVKNRKAESGQDFPCRYTCYLSDSCFSEGDHYHKHVPDDFKCKKFPQGVYRAGYRSNPPNLMKSDDWLSIRAGEAIH